MHVRLNDDYSPAELAAITAALLDTGVITAAEAYPTAELEQLKLRFYDLHTLLYPAWDRLVRYSNDDRKDWFYQSGIPDFYHWFARRVLQGCPPLQAYAPDCRWTAGTPTAPAALALHVGHLEAHVSYGDLNHPQLIDAIIAAVNQLLKQAGFEVAFYPVEMDETLALLLLSPLQYQRVLRERLLRFSAVKYPEVEAWRAALRDEDLPF